jgi:hypothetical protein
LISLGFGAGLAFSAQVCSNYGLTTQVCYWYHSPFIHIYPPTTTTDLCPSIPCDSDRARHNDTFAYIRPSFTDDSIRFYGDSSLVSNLQLTTTSSQTIAFDGTGFNGNENRMVVYYGTDTKPTLYQCHMSPTLTQAGTVVCNTENNAIGQSLRLYIDYGGLPGPILSNDRISMATDLPAISKVSGCSDVLNTTTNCPYVMFSHLVSPTNYPLIIVIVVLYGVHVVLLVLHM